MKFSYSHTFELFLFLILFFLQIHGHIVLEENSITVLSPNDLRGKRNGAIGSFGMPSYGEPIIGSLVSPKDSYGCGVFEGGKPFKYRSYHPTIVLLNRGGCSFSLKVYHAQKAGAAAVLIMDVIDEPLMLMGSHRERDDSKRLNGKILIPYVLIQLSFGKSLKNYLNKQEQVLLKIDQSTNIFSTPPPIDRIVPNEDIPSPVKPENPTPNNSKKDHVKAILEKCLIALK
ncbi:vacuolar-sorting receptor 7-like [Vicia villosa]|uniref:vacuolar-sorting receptor 7-like n=1 Tax=Vicia villosa TaxID=3911 RepID=UPI00273AF7DF|nr:vacuolar-sorting receptor 7-like [Vicia villosa]